MSLTKLASFLACPGLSARPRASADRSAATSYHARGCGNPIGRPAQPASVVRYGAHGDHGNHSPAISFEPRIGRSVSLDHAAQMLGVSRRTIYNRIRDGRLQTIRTLGGSQRVLLDSVQEIAASAAGRWQRALTEPSSDRRVLERHMDDTHPPTCRCRRSDFCARTPICAIGFPMAVAGGPLRRVVRGPAAPGRDAGAGCAQHRARLSADLADHLAAGSQSIDVIVHGDRGDGRRARRALQPASSSGI